MASCAPVTHAPDLPGMGLEAVLKHPFQSHDETHERDALVEAPFGQEAENVQKGVTYVVLFPKGAFPSVVKLSVAGAAHRQGPRVGGFQSEASGVPEADVVGMLGGPVANHAILAPDEFEVGG